MEGRRTRSTSRLAWRGWRRARRRFVCGLLLAPLMALAMPVAAKAPATPTRILVVLSQRAPIYENLAEDVFQGLRSAQIALEKPLTLTPSELAATVDNSGHFPDVDLIIPVGTVAAQSVAAYSTPIPVYFTLITRATYERLISRFSENFGPTRIFSALFLNQPLSRKVALVRAGLPSVRKLGVLFGPATRHLRPELEADARAAGLQLVAGNVDTKAEIQPALETLLRESDVLLALPDPGIYNRITIRNILITSFRYGKPVIGYSASFVKAGALMAVYSSPSQLSTEVAQRLAPALASGLPALPPAGEPTIFSVDVNYWVADSLAIPVPTEDAIETAMHRLEGGASHD